MFKDRLQAHVERVQIKGFRSFADVDVKLSNLTVMIGANGSGKSNFVRFFEMVSWMLLSRNLGEFVEKYGGADDQLFGGNKVTPRLEAEISLGTKLGRNDYRFVLSYGHPDRFFIAEEAFRYSTSTRKTEAPWQYLDSGHREAQIIEAAHSKKFKGVNKKTANMIVDFLRNCSIYQFHDTSLGSDFKKLWDADENNKLRSHGGNLAAVLYLLEQKDLKRFDLINLQISRVLPNFERFDIKESYGKVALRWKAKKTDKTFGAHLTSDGSLRFFALVTLLNLPPKLLPDVILLDEPELGLHPYAITLIAQMIKSVSEHKQVIIATQSPLLVDAFELSNITTLELKNGQTIFKELDPKDFKTWLEQDFTPGQMWQKNLLGGRP